MLNSGSKFTLNVDAKTLSYETVNLNKKASQIPCPNSYCNI